MLLIAAQCTLADITNGGFESWSSGKPAGWTTIDSGISVVSSASVVKAGNLSAVVAVNTTTQASTDLRQSISVVAGQQYSFSVWVYHTEGHVQARLYVDGYQGYSSAATTYQWQQLTYTYTAAATGSIEVGLRFYDVSGFDGSEIVYVDDFQPTGSSSSSGSGSGSTGSVSDLSGYYAAADGLSGYALKTALYNIIKNHSAQSYDALWNFYNSYERDLYYEVDGSLLDIYSENPSGNDAYIYTSSSDQCGSYNSEADCYNREHSFPRSWFGGAVAPMNSDVHHIFATDGYVNAKRSNYPYGKVGTATYTSANGSKLGTAASSLGYSGTVFEPIDAFKGDLARAYFYMATRYQNVIGNWQSNTTEANAVLNGSSDQVFETWFLNMLLSWNAMDPVSQKEIDRNNAAYNFQGNRNPYVDHPELVNLIWGN